MAAAVAEIAAGPSADAPAPAAAAAAAPAAAEVAPEKVDLPDKAAFERKVEALKATMAANKREKETLQARAGARGAGPSKSSVRSTCPPFRERAGGRPRLPSRAVPRPSLAPTVRSIVPASLQKDFQAAVTHKKAIR